MRENDGRKLDHKTLEALRLRAVEQVRQGAGPEDVAAALGLHRKTVYAWLKKYREGGQSALLARPVPGRPARLSEQQLRELSMLLIGTDPRHYDFELALWTADLVRELIQREFGVTLSRVSVSRQLGKIGMTPQRPLRRAYQRDPDVMSWWQRQEYPRIAARAVAAGATIYFAAEADVHDVGQPVPDRAPTSPQRPVQPARRVPAGRENPQGGRRRRTARGAADKGRLNLISAATAKGGAQRFGVFDASAAAQGFTEFCARLIHGAPGPVYLVVDGHPAHRTQSVADYAASTCGKLELFYLPAGYLG